MRVRKLYFPLLKEYQDRRGLAERLIRKKLKRKGWTVWRGGSLHNMNRSHYPNVERKYHYLQQLLQQHCPQHIDFLQYLCVVHHGMPDFFCYRDRQFKFVEVKLGYEVLRDRQKQCILTLLSLGYQVEIHVLALNTKRRVAWYDLEAHCTDVQEKQSSLKQFR